MSIKALALKEVNNLLTLVISLFFVRVVTMESPFLNAGFVVLGVPPWRELTVNDCYNKMVFQVWKRV